MDVRFYYSINTFIKQGKQKKVA